MKILTFEQLIEAGACTKQTKLFQDAFGEAVIVTETLAASLDENFDIDWAARNLLISADARAEYKKVASDWPKYRKVYGADWPEQDKERADAWVKYKKTCAVTFARLYITDQT